MDTHLDAEQFNEIWSFALKEIQRVCELPDTMMHLWFNDMKLTLVTEDSVVLTTETDFRRDVVTNRYTKQLTEVMSGILGYPVTVSVVSGQKERNLEKKMTAAADELLSLCELNVYRKNIIHRQFSIRTDKNPVEYNIILPSTLLCYFLLKKVDVPPHSSLLLSSKESRRSSPFLLTSQAS